MNRPSEPSDLSPLPRALAIMALAISIIIPPPGGGAMAASDGSAYRRAVEQRFAAWLESLWNDAQQRGITRLTFDAATRSISLDWSLPDLALPALGPGQPEAPAAARRDKQQPQAEFAPPAAYFPERSIDHLVARGRRLGAEWRDTLGAVEARFGVDANVVLAVWARETAFGSAKLPHNAMRVLATQAFMGRRKERFREELLLALGIVEADHIRAEEMASSWAGAMGHTQFMPSDFMKYAVDFDGDGKRDIWRSIPDALASTANSLRQNGWETGKTWAYEVRLPPDFDCTLQGPPQARPIADWMVLRVTRTFDRAFPPERVGDQAFLVLPAGTNGPAFLALKNFLVLKSYNFADLYAIYVGHLADRLANNRGFEAPWANVARFRRDEVLRLQEAMAQAGIEVGERDGLIGAQVRAAVGHYQRKLGRAVDCYPDRALLAQATP